MRGGSRENAAHGYRTEEENVHVEDRSLRCVVEKWFGRGADEAVHVSRVQPVRRNRHRCVRVCLARPAQPVTIFFFRHDDGNWSVVPPAG